MTWLREGDARTKFFHTKCNARRRKNHIHVIKTRAGVIVTEHAAKTDEISKHFTEILGTRTQRKHTLNWDELQIPTITSQGLDMPFTEGEVWAAIIASRAEKAPGPDGFTSQFLEQVGASSKMT